MTLSRAPISWEGDENEGSKSRRYEVIAPTSHFGLRHLVTLKLPAIVWVIICFTHLTNWFRLESVHNESRAPCWKIATELP